MTTIVAGVAYAIYIAIAIKVVSSIWKSKALASRAIIIVCVCALPMVDFAVSQAIYFSYKDSYNINTVDGQKIKTRILSFCGTPYRSGECNKYTPHSRDYFISPSDSAYKAIEVKKGSKVYVHDLLTDKVSVGNKLSGKFTTYTTENKLLTLVFRDKVAIDAITGKEIARHRYIARMTVTVPFFASLWSDFFLVDTDENEVFCDFDRLVFTPLED